MSSEFSVRRLARFPPSTSDLRIANLSELAGVTHRSETAERSVITTSGSINDYALSAARTMDRLMIGMSVEWLRSAISESIDIADASPVPIYGTRTTFSHDFSGLHADIGLLYDLGGGITLGAVYRSGFSTAFHYRSTALLRGVNGAGVLATTAESSTDGDSRVRWPHGFSLGIGA